MGAQHHLQTTIMVAMSGGVDSSVSALLLREAGRDIAAMFMKNWEEDDRDGACAAKEDAADAQAVADLLASDSVRSLLAGNTPTRPWGVFSATST